MDRIRKHLVRVLLRDDLANLQREIEEEFRFHIEMKAAGLEAGGMDPDSARAMAEDCFGDSQALLRDGLKDLAGARRTQRRRDRMDWIGQDIRDGFRRLARHPGFSLLAVVTLALGLSTSTAVFTYVNAYSQPFPGAAGQDLNQVFRNAEDVPYGPLSYPDFNDLVANIGSRFEVAASGQPLFAATVRHEALTEVIFGQGVTGNFFPVLRIEMSAGRGLSPDDDRPGAPPAVVISHEYWARRYASNPGVLGRTILLNSQPHTIVGVAGPSFLGSTSAFRPQIWMAFEHFKRVYWARSSAETDRGARVVLPYVRLAAATTEASLDQALTSLATELDRSAPLEDGSRRFVREPATWISPAVRQAESATSRIMIVAAMTLLLLACANMANLVLSAGARRGREMALRAAMGAGRGRLIRQLMAENLLLSLLAGALALTVAGPIANRLSSYFANPTVWGINVPRQISLDPKVLGFAVAASIAAGLLTGIIPALRVSNSDLGWGLRSGSKHWSPLSGRRKGRRLQMRDLFVSIQVALSIVLLFVAGLVLRSLGSAKEVDPGFNTEMTLASYISTSSMGIPASDRYRFFKELTQRFEEMPWVRAAVVSEQAPLSGHPRSEVWGSGIEEPISATVARVFPGYFEDLEMVIQQGRAFSPSDTATSPGVAVVNQSLAERLVAGGRAVGSMVRLPGADPAEDREFEVVGVVRNARLTGLLQEPGPVVYLSYPQHYISPGNAFLLRVTGNPSRAVYRMEEELHSVDPGIAIVNILPYSEVVAGFLFTQRMNAELFTIIAGLGLLLSAAGVFGVVSLGVSERRKEIGIRLAVGASKRGIIRGIVSRMFLALLLGLLAGLVGAAITTRLVESLVWGISTSDPPALLLGLGVLLGVVTLAVGIPLRKALRIDPVESLQAE